jgi:hypothetical protein
MIQHFSLDTDIIMTDINGVNVWHGACRADGKAHGTPGVF